MRGVDTERYRLLWELLSEGNSSSMYIRASSSLSYYLKEPIIGTSGSHRAAILMNDSRANAGGIKVIDLFIVMIHCMRATPSKLG